jgi:hypothetical protein
MAFVVKAPVADPDADRFSFDEKTMWAGKTIRPGDEIFLFASDHEGGHGLFASGVVTAFAKGPGIRISIEVKPVAKACRKLGRTELKPFRELRDGSPEAEIAWKLYRQATNKIAGVSDAAAAFLRTHF